MTRVITLCAVLASACAGDAAHAPAKRPHQRELDELLGYENGRRSQTDFRNQPTSDKAFGPNPHAVVALPGGEAVVGVLRGADAVVLLDASGRELARADAPATPAGVAITEAGDVVVSGEAESRIARYRVTRSERRATGLEPAGSIELAGAVMVSDVATGPGGVIYAVEEYDGRIVAISGDEQREIGRCHGPMHVIRVDRDLVVDCLLDHTIEIRHLDDAGMVIGDPIRLRHDGPIWGMTALRTGERLLLAVSGVEDRPLEREDGGFGYIDSFAFVYEVGDAARKLAEINLSELGVVTPKWLELSETAAGVELAVAGYATDRLAVMRWASPDLGGKPSIDVEEFAAGTTRVARTATGLIAANPLLDAWSVFDGTRVRSVPLARPQRSPESHVGERLFFTTLMARWNASDGKRSRFTCETCHYEGYVDGRTHFTGRGAVHATTKPLLGLFNNRPHFTRALDRTMTKMVDNEFKVANKHNGHDPWFELSPGDVSWLSDIEGLPDTLSPVYLRRSLMTFLMEMSFRPNPATRWRSHFSELERQGARVFRDHCERCHSARLVTDAPSTELPFSDWEAAVLSPAGPIVWASEGYQKTGVEPYVHEEGARTTSLRRLYKKYPYFTSGSAKTLDAVLEQAGWQGETFFHAAAPASARRLSDDERRALLAFLRLL